MACKYCEKMKRLHYDYNFCPYCGEKLKGGFVPTTILKSSTNKDKVNPHLTYRHNQKKSEETDRNEFVIGIDLNNQK